MKKLFKLFILICVCFIPVMVDAKANFEFKDDYDNKMFFEEKNGEYFYFDTKKDLYEANNVVIYGKNGNFLRRDSFLDEDTEPSPNAITSSKYFDSYFKMFSQNEDVIYDEENDIVYNVYYYSESFEYYDYSEDNYIRKEFNDDLEFTKKLLGKKYDAYLEVKSSDIEVESVIENDEYFVVYYHDYSDGVYYVSIMDKNYNIIKTFEDDIYCAYVYDDLIYAMTSPITLKIYKLDGSFLETLTISYDRIYNDSDYDFYPYVLYIKNNELFIMYHYYYASRPLSLENKDLFMEKANGAPYNYLTLVYSLNYDVNKTEPSNGDFTYESKFDEDGREYVELKISPLKGYSVEDIIVTDINGRRIEVTNNKFYMPTSDVRVEVKFGEYIPIPDTFSSISPVIKVFAAILIAFGIGIVSFSLKSKKVK